MGYRGDDLDLRTPQATAGEAAQTADPFAPPRARPAGSAGRAPIWVDETVLEACNHAYDVAAAHRAAEVRLEHLLYALTRIEEASDVLEARGVRVAPLRREAATAVATEIPAVHGSGKTNPRRAEAFEEVLRLAAAQAYRRQAPVGVGDLVHVLSDSGLAFQGLARLLPSVPRPAIAAADAGLDVEAVRERIRNGPGPGGRGLATDIAGLTALQAGTQDARLDALEASLRTLTQDLVNERKILSGVLQDLQRELMAQREDTSRLGGLTQDKIQAVLGDRLQSLEQAFLAARPASVDVGPLQDRLGMLERALQGEISVTRAAVEALSARPAVDLTPVLERIDALEQAAAEERQRAKAAEQALSESLAGFAGRLERQPAEVAAVVSPPLAEQLDALAAARDTQHAATRDSLAEAGRRLGALEEAVGGVAARVSDADGRAGAERAALHDLIEKLAAAVGQGAAETREAFGTLTEQLTRDLSELDDGIGKVHSDHRALASSMEAGSQDVAAAFTALVGRIESLEQAAARPVEMLEALSATVEKMHRVTVEKYYRRNRFWYWLFGTDDWLAASWPSQSARIAEELRAIKR